MTRFEFPDWLPTRMRYTADPVERLHSLVSEMRSLAGPERRHLRELRAWKIHHLCRLIDPDACAAPLSVRLNDAQASEILDAAAAALERVPVGERPPAVLISVIHRSAASFHPPRPSSYRVRAAIDAGQ